MKSLKDIAGYGYANANSSHAHAYLVPTLLRCLQQFFETSPLPRRIFDLGCGNGSIAEKVSSLGYHVSGVDPSEEGIAQANHEYPHINLRQGSGYDDLTVQYGRFPVVISLEVVEHVYAPRDFAKTLYELVEDNGVAIVSTPYHGYFKNLALALSGRMDRHFTALWDNGHIKFWSERTLSELLMEAGFKEVRFQRAGRIKLFAKSMIAVARR